MVKEHEREKPAHCQLGSELILAYSGLFLQCLPAVNSDVTGYVLLYNGQLYYRKNKGDPWVLQTAPSAYLFRDCACQRVFEVDSCKHEIKEVKFRGRVLDCSNHAIYEVNKCGEWIEVCDLDHPSSAAVSQALELDCDETVRTFDILAGLQKVKYVPSLSDDSAFADVEVDNVAKQITATLTNSRTPAVGAAPVSLVYKGYLIKGQTSQWAKHNPCERITKQKVYVTVLISRVNQDRLSASGVLGSTLTPSVPNPNQILAGTLTSALLANGAAITAAQLLFAPTVATSVLAQIGNWQTNPSRYVDGINFNAPNGEATIRCAGDYSIDVVLGYFAREFVNLTGESTVPYFLLWVYRGTQRILVAAAPIASGSGSSLSSLNLAVTGQVVLHADLTLQPGDLIISTYYDESATPTAPTPATARKYSVNGVTSQWTIEALGAPSN